MRCALVRCRARLVEWVDRLGRYQTRCPQCDRRKAGICQTCPNPVDGKVGVSYYCGPCRKQKQRQSVMRWQRNNLDVVAAGMRRRRWKAKHGRRPPKEKMTPREAGKLGGAAGQAARQAKLGPERVKAIAAHARTVRWAREKARKQAQQQREQARERQDHTTRRGANDTPSPVE